MKLAGKIAMVTGGALGIGQGIVRCLLEEGADVAIVDINQAKAEAAAGEAKGPGRRTLTVIADVMDSRQCEHAIQRTIDTFGQVDILVNNVGGESRFYQAKPGQIYLEEAEWDDTIRLNLKTTMLMSRAISPYFIKQRSGKIVNIASIGGRPPAGGGRGAGGMGESEAAAFSPMMSYGVAKAGVIQFTRQMALQLAEFNINVNCICPGILYTPLYEKSAPRRITATPEAKGMTAREFFDTFMVPRVPLKREQTPEDIGRMAVFFASEDARNITGQSINVDGGMVPG